MDPAQLLDLFAREHDIISHDVRVYVQTQIDETNVQETETKRLRVLALLVQAEANQDIFDPADLARLRLSCSAMVDALDSYIKDQRDPPLRAPVTVVQHVRTGGRPRKHIDLDWLAEATTYTGPKGIAKHLPDVGARTVRRRQLEAGIAPPQPPVMHHTPGLPSVRNVLSRSRRPARPVPSQVLDAHVSEFINRFPNAGRSIMEGQVLTTGLTLGQEVTRADVSASIRRVTGVPGHFGRIPIVSKKYRVAGPGSLWHHDGQHGLIHWKLITHAFVDGHSRRVMGIRTSNNNRAVTVLALFLEIVEHWGFPSRVRGDHGVENLLVAALQEAVRGLNRGSYIWGPSTGNTRVERMWVDVVVGYIDKWKRFFLDLESNHGLDRNDDAHIWLLHFLFLDAINADGNQWALGWNAHHFTRLPPHQHARGSHLQSPNELHFFGQTIYGCRNLPVDELDAAGDAAIAAFGAGDDHDDDNDDPAVRRIQHDQHADDVPQDDRNPNGWGRPRRMFEVRVPEPGMPFAPEIVDALDAHLAATVDPQAKTMDLRRLWWISACEFLSNIPTV